MYSGRVSSILVTSNARLVFSVFTLIFISACSTLKQIHPTGPVSNDDMVVTAHPLAIRVASTILEQGGNAIATTINSYFGSKVWVDGARFFMNNEMDDFSAKPGIPNQFGLLGNEINSIKPEKKMLSSMTPDILERKGELYMVLGSSGGSTIITTVLNVTLFDMTMQEAVDTKRFHHQWMPDIILHETGCFTQEVEDELRRMNYEFQDRRMIGMCDAILVQEKGLLEGGPDNHPGRQYRHGALTNNEIKWIHIA